MTAKVEFHRGELFPRLGFIATNLTAASRAVVRFYNKPSLLSGATFAERVTALFPNFFSAFSGFWVIKTAKAMKICSPFFFRPSAFSSFLTNASSRRV